MEDAIFPDPFSSKRVRIAEAERLIRHYRLSTSDQVGEVDLMLAMVEAGTEQAADLGYGDDAYFASLERVLRRSEAIGWGYGDAVHQITGPVVSPRAGPRPPRRARRP